MTKVEQSAISTLLYAMMTQYNRSNKYLKVINPFTIYYVSISSFK